MLIVVAVATSQYSYCIDGWECPTLDLDHPADVQ